ncbi:hypothetical protein, variant 1 [Aphanomyces invadans]|uniref:Myotubularin phosphatase domain-containing protein n=1 Tax=Aphanomyces invadans TaxID=157072 RepID=A0A024TDX6_9STRA|nr:hypothetical protein, variant 1 [Aphanomyces invadans]ETV92253.1 hypothetical protein, variant 1 [Aphanomyces invadans]|eukprot:XP_008879217.1 hypothetical protein, variant 1 [Aphanomyces invadans]
MATCSSVMRNGARCTSPVPTDDPSATMCAHHQRMARVMALAPKKPPSVDRAPSTTFGLPPAPHANPLFQTTTSVVHVRPSAVGHTAVPLPIHVPTESFSDYLKVSFPGEVKAASLPCSFDVSSREGVSGTLIVTNYRLRFEPASTHRSATFSPALLEAITPGLPTACVSKLAYPQTTSSSNAMPTQIVVFFRNCRTWILRGNVTELMTTLNKLVFVESPLHLFAFAKGNVVDGDHANGHAIYDLFSDFADMGVHLATTAPHTSPYRVTDANRSYGLCPTYPPQFVVPSAMTDAQVAAVASFRSKGRMPLCCWVHAANTASIWRCAQPKRGLFHAQNADDDYMLWLIAQTNKINSEKVWIVDCRPELNARANNLTGGGTESGSLRHATVSFMNIANIHAMRESLEAVRQLALTPSMEADLHWLSRVEDTKWLMHVRLVLRAALQTAHAVHESATSVVVHCSDGWDRTAQVCALSQLLLDPKYRTLKGFMTLIDKEWIKAGHKFDDRVGPGKVENDDQAPIFIQFLDCVWQLHRQYPTYFEFTGLALLALAFHSTSGRFGTFLGNCDRDRAVSLRVPVRTPSLWAFMLDHAAQFRNPFFRPYDAHDHGGGALVPWPVAIVLRRVVLWDDMYFANPSCGNTSKPPAMAAASFRQAKTAAEDLEMAMASAQHQAAAHLS